MKKKKKKNRFFFLFVSIFSKSWDKLKSNYRDRSRELQKRLKRVVRIY